MEKPKSQKVPKGFTNRAGAIKMLRDIATKLEKLPEDQYLKVGVNFSFHPAIDNSFLTDLGL